MIYHSVLPEIDRSWVRSFLYVWPVLVMLCLGAVFFVHTMGVIFTADDIGTPILTALHLVYEKFNYKIFTNPFFLIGIPLIFWLQTVIPVEKEQSNFCSSTRVDFLFTLLMLIFYALISPTFRHFSHDTYDQNFWYLSLSQKIEFSNYVVQCLLGYLAVDFMGWFHHVVRHKVSVFWEFHVFHHSQRSMNPFSNERVHPFDWLFANSIKFIPAFFFANSFQIILGYIVIHRFLDHLNHSNVRTNLGWFRYVLVTPQSHRVHHSVLPEHADCNFGVSLSIWDHLFGTQCRDYDVYPPTGIQYSDYPSELDGSVGGTLSSIKDQLLYPFGRVWRNGLHLARAKR